MLEGGLAATTMEAIAARAEVSKSTIYKWWPSRGEIALEGFLAQVQDTIDVPAGAGVAESMRIQLRALIAVFRDTSAGPLIRALVAQAVAEPDLAVALREHWLEPRRDAALSVLRRGVRSGELRKDTDVDAVADQLFAPVYHRLNFGHDPLGDGLGDVLVDQLMRGVGARPQPRKPTTTRRTRELPA